MGRVIFILRLAGVAVFLFGLGFMYLNDVTRPGRLENFRWGRFLLLALTYSLFFIIFTVLNLGGDLNTGVALLLSALVSFPLLVFHVGRFLGMSFALTRVLPLAVFTLGIIVNGVYGGPYRLYVFTAFPVFAVAFITLTFNTWSEKKKAYLAEKERLEKEAAEKEKAAQEACEKREAEAEAEEARGKQKAETESRKAAGKGVFSSVEEIRAMLEKAVDLQNRAEFLLESEDEFPRNVRENMKQHLERLSNAWESYQQLMHRTQTLLTIPDPARFRDEAERMRFEAGRLKLRLSQISDMLKAAADDASQFQEKQKRLAEVRDAKGVRCMACGAENALSNYCHNCGVRIPEKLICAHCGAEYMLPMHMADWKKAGRKIHCIVCGRPHDFTPPKIFENDGEDHNKDML